MGLALLLGVVVGYFANGWVGKLIVFPIGIAGYLAFRTARDIGAKGSETTRHFLVLLVVSSVSSGLTGFVAAKVQGLQAVDWSDTEKLEIEHFKTSISQMRRLSEATDFGAGTQVLEGLPFSDWQRMISETLASASLVGDGTLDKVHPDLKLNYREKFEKSLEIQSQSYEALSRGEAGVQLQLAWQTLYDQWAEWYSAHRIELSRRIKY